MTSYSQVSHPSQQKLLDEKKALLEQQKVTVVNVLKEEYMITGNVDDLPAKEKKRMAARLSEYWSPKTGLNQNGVRLINENIITLSEHSNKKDVELYIQKCVKKNLVEIVECFRAGKQNLVVESFQKETTPLLKKKLDRNFIIDTIWALIGKKMKNGL